MVRVVLVRPEHDINVGSVARVMKNFGCGELYLVKPVCKLGFEATLFAKHSKEIIEGAVKTSTIAQALKGCDFAIGTTGVATRYRSRLKNLVPIEQAVSKISPGEKAAIVLGGESRGLSFSELGQCDVVATIPTSSEHPVLNLSHAAAVCLYEVFRQQKVSAAPALPRVRLASRAKRRDIARLFGEIVHAVKAVHDPQKVSAAFANVLERGRPTEEEAQALYAPLGPLFRFSHKKGKWAEGSAKAKR